VVSDSASLLFLVDEVNRTCQVWPDQVSAESGFFSVPNLIEVEKRYIEGYVPNAQLINRGVESTTRSPEK
jgi:hypothetical protein